MPRTYRFWMGVAGVVAVIALTSCGSGTPEGSAPPTIVTASPTTNAASSSAVPTPTAPETTASTPVGAFRGDLRTLFIAKPSGAVASTSDRFGADNKVSLDELNMAWYNGSADGRARLTELLFKRGEHAEWRARSGDIVIVTVLQFGSTTMAQQVLETNLNTYQADHEIIYIEEVRNGFMIVYPYESGTDETVAASYFSKRDLFMEFVVISGKSAQKTGTDLLIQQYRRLP